ncbi:MAG: phosphoribosylamine--glycine ligase [Bacteroidetes bacterium]|nr:MAG: phosphoribosylamine--glycine ligase [Bacteroidota bacterium]MBL1143618.1 phosphoribosylamine--glycine ligase [Bacteroidota bacterium]NOG56420.1 phosphoribosylamine--glycine ligase [Bacteroidota bacterium]
MNVLILGSGGREHAIAWKINQSKQNPKIFIAPGNAGTKKLGINLQVNLSDFDALANLVEIHQINLLVVGPEAPLVEGIVNYFRALSKFDKLKIIGPDAAGAQLEGSKDFAKEFMAEFNVPTARYKTFDSKTIEQAYAFLETLNPPYVLKADGLAGGKGVLILNNLEQAKVELANMLLDEKFGKASSQVVIEEYLDGIEMSVFVLTDGKDYLILPEAKDYKRIGEGDTGLNTGGMGAISPVPFVNSNLMQKIEDSIVKPSVAGLNKRGFNYKGFLFIGLMIVENNPFVIEYNVRMGDPETEVVMPRIKSDLLSHLLACSNGKLAEEKLEIDDRFATTVMLVAGGYPEKYEKGKPMLGFEKVSDSMLFHAGTTEKDGEIITNGGRVLAITSYGNNMKEALSKSFANASTIDYHGKYYRKDIGFDL